MASDTGTDTAQRDVASMTRAEIVAELNAIDARLLGWPQRYYTAEVGATLPAGPLADRERARLLERKGVLEGQRWLAV